MTVATDRPLNALEAELEGLLSETVAEARRRERTAFNRELALCGGAMVLFGAGTIGRRILARLRQDGLEPYAFSDNNPSAWGTVVDGLPVLRPADAAARYGRTSAFIVTIYNPWHNFVETREQLRGLGCGRVFSVLPLRWKYHETFLPYYRDDLPHKVLPEAPRIRQALALWADDASRREFVAQVRWRLRGDYDALSPLSGRDPYFAEGFFPLSPDEVVVDCGAFDGDTLRAFLRHRGASFARYLALEPDPSSFRKLRGHVGSLPDDVRSKVEARPWAVGERPGLVGFSAEGSLASAVSDRGTTVVKCVRLDDLSTDLPPTFIKMDVEGSEPDALRGARRLVEAGRTAFAACVYHAQSHLWDIPLLIHGLNPRFRYYLRPYMPEGWDLVCYAVPEGR